MEKLLRDKKGVSLIWVLILLVVVGGLSAALLSSAVFNINFGSDEVNTSRSFYAAEAGVERTKAEVFSNNISNIEDFNISGTLNYDSNFMFGYEVYYDSGVFVSEGYMGESDDRRNIQKIEFALNRDALGNIAFLINMIDEIEDLDDYLRWPSEQAERPGFSKDNIALIETKEWEEFLSENYGFKFDGEYPTGVRFPEELDMSDDYDYIGVDEWERRSMDRIETRDEPYKDKFWYLTPNYYSVEVGEDDEDIDIDDIEEWSEDDSYEEGDFVYIKENSEFKYYKAIQNVEPEDDVIPGDKGGSQNYWKDITGDDGDLKFGEVTIEDSILVVDGAMDISGRLTLINTLILVKDEIIVSGGQKNVLDESLILTFNDDLNKDSLRVDGGHFDISYLSLPVEDWPGIQEVIEDLEDYMFEFILVDWRQVR